MSNILYLLLGVGVPVELLCTPPKGSPTPRVYWKKVNFSFIIGHCLYFPRIQVDDLYNKVIFKNYINLKSFPLSY